MMLVRWVFYSLSMFQALFMEGKSVSVFIFACAHAPSAVRIGCYS